jgi:Resolvase, N terminal domain
MLGVFAEFERGIIRERVNAGLARAQANGTKLERRRVEPAVVARILELRALGKEGRPKDHLLSPLEAGGRWHFDERVRLFIVNGTHNAHCTGTVPELYRAKAVTLPARQAWVRISTLRGAKGRSNQGMEASFSHRVSHCFVG